MGTARWVVLWVAAAALAACGGGGEGGEDRREVVLYSSVDGELLRAIVDDIESRTDLRVRVVGDTEATKTTGLVERLLSERGRPRADVWWSSEPFGTIRLAREGALAPLGLELDAMVEAGWPPQWRGAGDLWAGFASRGRVLAYSTDRLEAAELPRSLEELAAERWRGRVGIARPQFGTTRGHFAALVHLWGPARFEAWLEAMRGNGVRIFDGNATVVQEIGRGTIDLALTDTDDVFAAQRQGVAVDLADLSGAPEQAVAILLPNTVARVAGGPNPEAARALLEAILGPQTERFIAQSDSRNYPLHPQVARETGLAAPPWMRRVDLEAVADVEAEAMGIVARVLGGG